MPQFIQLLHFINGSLKPYSIILLIAIPCLSMNKLNFRPVPPSDPVQAIRDLREGYLIVRIPAFKAKIDTLQSMISRNRDSSTLPRLQKLLHEAIEERDSLLADYTSAFRDVYKFSKTAYFFDYEGHDLRSAHFYHMDHTPMPADEIRQKPVFYLYFERTEESRIDALVFYDIEGHKIPPPFPNNFSRGGVNFLFLKVSAKSFPAWRVGKINKRLFKFWNENRES
jgi:hypothetical protein